MAQPTHQDTLAGFGFALTAYLLWGFLPFFMKEVAHIAPIEVIAHRVIWSVPIAAAVLWATGRIGTVAGVFRNPKALGMAVVTASLISVNWGIYVWSIGSGHALDAALGYYINPLFSIFLGAFLLGERLQTTQKAAIAVAAVAVLILTVQVGRIPLAALALTVTWGFYAYFKRALPIGPNEGFLLEVLLLTPPAIGVVLWFHATGTGHFLAGNLRDDLLLMACGLVTAVPMMIYANAAKRLRLTTIGILQYIAPTMILLIAVTAFGEPFGPAQMIAFPMIWAALALYTWGLVAKARRQFIPESRA